MQRSIIAPAERVTNLRWGIALLLGIGVLIGALDRANLSVAGAEFYRTIAVAAVGTTLAGFAVLYIVVQLVAGLVLDRFGVTPVGRIVTLLAAVFALVPAAVGSFGTLFAARAVFDLDKMLANPIGAKATGYWFPVGERGLATAIFDSAGKLATAIGVPLLTVVFAAYGARAAFFITGILSLLFFGAFYLFYRDPSGDTRLTHAERTHIENGGAQPAGLPANGSVTATFFSLLAQTKVWGLIVGYAAYSFAFAVLLLWLPAWLATTFGMPALATGVNAAIPWLCAAVADLLVGGFIVDAMIKAGMDATRARRTILICGMLLGLCVYGATTTHDPNVAIVYLSIALAGLGMSSPVTWSIPSLIAPHGAVGSLAAILNAVNVVMLAAAAIVAGRVYAATSSFTTVFVIAAVVLIAGILSYVFLLGRIEPVAEP